MKQYTVTLDTKTPDFFKNEMESIVINAKDYKDAVKVGRRLARRENQKFVSVRLKK